MPFPDIDPIAFSIGPLAIHWYGLAYVAGILLGWAYARRLAANESLWPVNVSPISRTQLDDFIVWAALGVVLGGRLGYIFFYDLPAVLRSPVRALEIWNGGMQDTYLAINFSPLQFEPALPARLAAFVGRHGIRPERIVVEITEAVLMHDNPEIRMMPLNCVISRPRRKFNLSTSANENATAPELTRPRNQRSTLNPAIVTIIRPESSAIEALTPVMNRVKRSTVSW